MDTNFNWHKKPSNVFVASPPSSQIVFQYKDEDDVHKKTCTLSIKEILNTPGGDVIITWANRKYISDLFKLKLNSLTSLESTFTEHKQKEEDTRIVGCLPVVLLDISTTENNLILDPRRLTNWFIQIISRVIPIETILPPELVREVNMTFYIRDTNIFLPRHGVMTNIPDLIFSALNTLETENIWELGDNGEKLSHELLSISCIFKLLIPKLQSIFISSHRKRNISGKIKSGKFKMSPEFQKILHENNLLNKIEKWSENSLKFISDKLREYSVFFLNKLGDVNDTNIWAVKEFINVAQKSETIPIYFNENITFRIMIHAIGEIFHSLFTDILPNESMESAIHGALYHMIYLHDLKLLDTFKKYLYIPILYRLIYSCYKINSPFIKPSLAYLSENHSDIYHSLLEYQNKNPLWQGNENTDLIAWMEINCESSVDRLCLIASQSEKYLNDEKFMDALYWTVYDIRGQALDYYIIFLLIVYKNSLSLKNIKLGNTMSKENKTLNCKNLVSPFFRIFVCFYDYIQNIPPHLITVDILNSSEFGELPQYRHIIITALSDFFKGNEDIFSSLLKD